jgi:hypothetical protein
MQNVNINKEVENAMMAPPQQPRGIVDLLASELKARDAKARNQLNTMMAPAPDPNTIISQNEKETENNVRQEITQKMQSMVVKENQNKARMNQALAGIAGQRANNMTRMANGGIIGYAPGGGVKDLEKQLEKIARIEEGRFYQPRTGRNGAGEQVETDKNYVVPDDEYGGGTYASAGPRTMLMNLISGNKGQMRQSEYDAILEQLDTLQAQEAQKTRKADIETGIRRQERQPAFFNKGGIVGYADGGSVNLLEAALEAEGITDPATIALIRSIYAQESSSGQNTGVSPAGANEEATERRRTGIAETLQNAMPEEGIASLAPSRNPGATSEAARQFNRAAMQARNTRDPTGEGFFSGLIDAYNTLTSPIPEGAPASYVAGARAKDLVTAPFDLVGGFLRPTRGNQLTIGHLAGGAEQFGRGALGMEPATDDAPTTTKAEEIIASGPSTTPAEPAYDPMKGVEAIADPNLRRAIEGAQAAPAAEQDGEVAATQLASTVASNPTPENMSRFESEISRLMEKRESPVRALSSFLKSFSQARGGSMGQNLAIATTAMNAADDAMDNQIIALEQLRRADQISERDFNLKQEQLTSQKGLLDAQASYYKNYRDMQVEIAELKEIGDTQVANRRLYQSILDLAAANLPAYQMAAKAELGATDMFSPEVRARADAMMKQAVQTEYRDAQRFFDLPETDGAGLGADVRSELETYVGQQ